MSENIFENLFGDNTDLEETKNLLNEINNNPELLEKLKEQEGFDSLLSLEKSDVIEVLKELITLFQNLSDSSEKTEEPEKIEEMEEPEEIEKIEEPEEYGEDYLTEEQRKELDRIDKETSMDEFDNGVQQQEPESEKLDLSKIKPESEKLSLDNIKPSSYSYDDEELYYDEPELTRFGRFLKIINKPAKGILISLVPSIVMLSAIHFTGGALLSLILPALSVMIPVSALALVAIRARRVYSAIKADGEEFSEQTWFQKKLQKSKEKKAAKKQSKKPNIFQKWNQKRKEKKAIKQQPLDPAVEIARLSRQRDDAEESIINLETARQARIRDDNIAAHSQTHNNGNDLSSIVTELQNLKTVIASAFDRIDDNINKITGLNIGDYDHTMLSGTINRESPATTVKREENVLRKAM